MRWSGCGTRGRICSPLPGGPGKTPGRHYDHGKPVGLGQAETDNARFLAKSQEARPGAERWRSFAYARAAVERGQACALR